MTGDTELTAAELRAMGIDHDKMADDDDLVETVTLLLAIGIPLEDMIDEDLTFIAGPKLIRPDATIHPTEVVLDDPDPAFREKTALALGFNIDDDSRLLTPAEVETIIFVQSLRPIIGDEDLLALLRVMGNSMARVARSVISALRLHYEAPILHDSGSLAEVARVYQKITQELLPPFLDAATTVLRRHLSVATSMPTVWNVDGTRAATMEKVTVGFVDLVDFTSFTERADLKEFIDALTTFETQAQEIIVGNGGTLVKLIGDEAMFVAPTPASAVEIARRLAGLSLPTAAPASVRIGLASGDVVAVGGDYYGTVVNTASRVVHEAEPGEIIVTAAVANGAHASARFDAIGARELRGISEPVPLFRLG